MPRLSPDQWADIRAEREAGASFGDLASRYDVSKPAIVKRSAREKWGDWSDVAEAVRRKVTEKVTGVVTADPVKKAAAIEAAADRAVEVLRRHQAEPEAIRAVLYAGLEAHRIATTKAEKGLAFDDLKAAKISSEAILNLHRAERQAFNLGIDSDQRSDGARVVFYLPENGR